MKILVAIALLSGVSISMSTRAEEAFPRSAELLTAQAELDAIRADLKRDEKDAQTQRDPGTQKRVDAALEKRDSELDKRNADWLKHDRLSVFKAQVDTCSAVRRRLGKKAVDYVDDLRYAGFSMRETLAR